MADLTKLSDEELDKMIAAKQKAPHEMSDQELDAAIAEKQMAEPYLNPVEKGLKWVGETIEPVMKPYEDYVAGPIRRGVVNVAENLTSGDPAKMIGTAISPGAAFTGLDKVAEELAGKESDSRGGFIQGFGEEDNPHLKELAAKAGISDKPLSEREFAKPFFSENPEDYKKAGVWQKGGMFDVSPAGVVGGAGDIAVDPLTYVGGGAAKGIASGEAASTASKLASLAEKKIPGMPFTAGEIIGLANESTIPVDAAKVSAAAERLGTKATPGMLSGSPTLRGLESSLHQEPSLAGIPIRKSVEKVRGAVQKSVEQIAADTTAFTKFEAGEAIKNGMTTSLAERYKPIAEQFEKLRGFTKDIPVAEVDKASIAKNIVNHPDVLLTPNETWAVKARNYADNIANNVKTADDVKRLRTLVGNELKLATKNERAVLGNIYDKLTGLEERTIKKAAVAQAASGSEGRAIGKQMIGELRGAKKGYKEMMGSVEDISKATGIKSSKTIENFLEAVDNVPSEQLVDKVFKVNDLKSLGIIEKEFPNEFKLMRQAKIKSLVESSQVKGVLDPKKFINNLKDMGPEALQKIFGTGASSKLEDVKTVINAIPDKIGPSGTPQGEAFKNILNIKDQLEGAGKLKLYQKLSNPTVPIQDVSAVSPSKLYQTYNQVKGAANKVKNVAPRGVMLLDQYRKLKDRGKEPAVTQEQAADMFQREK